MNSVMLIRVVAGILVLVLVLLYFQPSYIGRKKRHARAIFLVNLLTGWSIVGWIVALIWAISDDPLPVVAVQPQPSTQGPARPRKFNILALVVVISILAIALDVLWHNKSSTPSAPNASSQIAQKFSDAVPAYHESNEILDPYDLSKNPYQWKYQSGILDTINVPLVMNNGTRVGQVAYPGGCLKFNKMLDEHTAVYEVMVGHEDVQPDGEIAVLLSNSDPPTSLRPWRIFVEGPMDALNGLGQTITLTAVRFEGYYTPPPSGPARAVPPASTPQTHDADTPSSEPAAK
jgi:hypothetical protein